LNFSSKVLANIFGKYYYNKAYNLVIITHNNQRSIEGIIWSYHFWNGSKGREGIITCLDTGSSDDTLLILKRLANKYSSLNIVALGTEENKEKAIQEWLLTQKQNKEKLLVLDLRESNEERDYLKNFA